MPPLLCRSAALPLCGHIAPLLPCLFVLVVNSLPHYISTYFSPCPTVVCKLVDWLIADRSGYCEQYTTNVALCEDEENHPDTFYFRYSVDERGVQMKGMTKEQLDTIVLE